MNNKEKKEISWETIKRFLVYEVNLFPKAKEKKPLGKLLLELGLITEEQLEEATIEATKQGAYLGKALVEKGILTEEQFSMALEEQKKTGSPLIGVLQQRVTWEGIKKVLGYDFFPAPEKKEEERFKNILIEAGWISEQEWKKRQEELKKRGQDLGELLLGRGIITSSQLEHARMEQKETKSPLERVLINLGYLSPKEISDALTSEVVYPEPEVIEEEIARYLLENKLLTDEELGELRRKEERMEEFLLKNKIVSAEEMAKLIGRILNVPFIDLKEFELDPEVVKLIPLKLIQEYCILPLKREAKNLIVAMTDPRNISVRDSIENLTGLYVVPRIVSQDAFNEKLSKLLKGVEKETISIEEPFARPPEGASAVDLVDSIIERAFALRATDIHLEAQKNYMRVRYRIDALLHDVMNISLETGQEIISRIKVLADMDITEKRIPQDGHYIYQLKGTDTKLDLRISTAPTMYGESAALRLLRELTLTSLNQLGFEENEYQKMQKLLAKPYGMILATGPVRSGKTTTLYACLNHVDIFSHNVMTIEDPIECEIPGITQIQVNYKIDLDFTRGLKTILRHDPDTIMVGEIRDPETAKIASRAAMTGILVFSSLHTNDAPGTITVLLNFGIPGFVIASSLIGVIAQRLVRKICHHCREEYSPPSELLEKLPFAQEDLNGARFFHGRGCDKCRHTGYWGQTGVFEILEISPEIRRLILQGASEEEIKEKSLQEGTVPLQKGGFQRVNKGITTLEEYIRIFS